MNMYDYLYSPLTLKYFEPATSPERKNAKQIPDAPPPEPPFPDVHDVKKRLKGKHLSPHQHWAA